MLFEILKELRAAYSRWHAKNRLLSGVVVTIMALLLLQTAWGLLSWIALLASPGFTRHAVSGRITWRGQPLESGIISFRPLGGQPFEAGTLVQQGVYAIPRDKGLAPGSYRVRVHAAVADPSFPEPAAGERDMRPGIESLPSKYNSASELTAEIGGWGRTQASFDLVP